MYICTVIISTKDNEARTACLFLYNMEFKKAVQNLLEKALNERSDLFLIDFTIDENNKINIVLDGDNGITLSDCIAVSRAIEHNLDREDYDFALEVTSAGASSPLRLVRQYQKNEGRKLEVITTDLETIEARLTTVTDNDITLKWKVRQPKKIGKGKETVEKTITLPFTKIKQAKVIIEF